MSTQRMVAIVGLGAILPDAFDVASFWENILTNKSSITEVPLDRWDANLYYDPDPKAIDKTYSKIGAFVRDYQFDPLKNGIAIPPKVLALMDMTQQWAIAASQQALKDYGYPEKKLDPERVAVIFGNANAGERHYRSTFRIYLPEYLDFLHSVPDFEQLPAQVRSAIESGIVEKMHAKIPAITEDTMPGELSNIIAGRVSNVFNFNGATFVTDAACASSLAALQAASEGLFAHKFDAVLTGGIDRNMGPESYVKFSKIGALSADGSRPYAEGANGFVMGEGAVVFLMKRLEDAERDGDKIYALVRGIGGSADGKGKGITAPNPSGQQFAIERAWREAGVDPRSVGLIEGHGTSTKVGDVAEVSSLNSIFGSLGLKIGSVALGSVKSNIGHLKSAAGAVGLLKTILALHHHVLPPSANFAKPNPNIDFAHLPFWVNSRPQEWTVSEGSYRFAGVSSFGFGGTNFHIVLEEYFPGVAGSESLSYAIPAQIRALPEKTAATAELQSEIVEGVMLNQNIDLAGIKEYVLATVSEKTGYPVEMLDLDLDLEADLGIDTVKQAELFAVVRTHYGIPRREDLILAEYNTLAKVIGFVSDAFSSAGVPDASDPAGVQPAAELIKETPVVIVQATELKPYQGLFFASAESVAGLVALLQTALQSLREGILPDSHCPTEAELSCQERIAIDYVDAMELSTRLEKALVGLDANDGNMWKALQAHGIYHGSGVPGKVAFLFPGQGSQYVNMLLDLRDSEPVVRDTFDEADRIMEPILGRPLTSFIYTQGGEEEIQQVEKELKNTAITQPAMLTANVAILRVLRKYGVKPDMVIGHSLGEYAALVAADVLTFAEALEVVSARGREMTRIKVDDPGCMAAVSAPIDKVEEVIRASTDYVVIANINSPVQSVLGGTTKAINAAIARFQAEGFQAVKIPVSHAFHTKIVAPASQPLREVIARMNVKAPTLPIVANVTGDLYPTDREAILDILARQVASPVQFIKGMNTLYDSGVRIYIEVGPKRVLNALAADNLKGKNDVTIIATNHPRKGGKASFNEALCGIYAAGIPNGSNQDLQSTVQASPIDVSQWVVKEDATDAHPAAVPIMGSVVISGAGLGLPGRNKHVFDDENISSILDGEMRIEQLPEEARRNILEKHVTRLIKSEAGAVMEEITDLDQTLKLAGQSGEFNLVEEFGVPLERAESLDASSQLAMAAGIEALRDAGIPLVMHYRQTTTGTYLPDRWKLPASMQDETGVIFCSAFPGMNRMAEEADQFYENRMLEQQLTELRSITDLVGTLNPTGQTQLQDELHRRIIELENRIKEKNYHFDRRFIFRVLSMGHSQFAEYIGARGPNTHVNAACATTTHAVAIAEDWIRGGRCRRVVVISGDDVTNPTLVSWIGTSLFASGAATSEGNLRLAALPFDRRRNGMIMGMGAAALVIESEDSVRERGVRAIGEIFSTGIANSAFHGTRLDVQHITEVMERLLTTAEHRFGIRREQIAPETIFMSHETYTPARGGSASAEIHALRSCFGEQANQVVIANTKGFTGHTMGVGIEDVVALKALETGKVPPIAHIQEGFEPDAELGDLNLSRGGVYNPQFALRLGAGFGSQIAMSLVHKIPGTGARIDSEKYNRWLASAAGYDQAEVEIVKRTLRIKSQGMPAREPARTTWIYGQGPSIRATALETKSSGNESSVPIAAPAILAQPVTVESQRIQAEIVQTGTSQGDAGIKQHVLEVVSDKTGYPVEMLDLDLDLEADLGIDTVKQAELFASIRTHYGILRREDLILAEYNTLSKVIGFVKDNLPSNAAADESVEHHIDTVTEVAAVVSEVEADSFDVEAAKQYVLATVSEKTGYPVEMLDLDLDLEADLGIDTVKQAEFFATVRTHYDIPRREDLILAEYNTLAKVIGFVRDALSAAADAEPSELVLDQNKDGDVAESDAVSDHEEPPTMISRRVPVPVLFPRLDLCLPTGVDLREGRVVIVSDNGKVAEALVKKLKAAGAETWLTTVSTVGKDFQEWLKIGKVTGVYFLAALEADPKWGVGTTSDWQKTLLVRSEALYTIGKFLPESAFFIAATRMGGLHGLQNSENPLGGLVTGFMKSLHRERPQQFIKAVDFTLKAVPSFIAETLIAETQHDSVSVEIGREGDLRYGVVLRESQPVIHDLKMAASGSVFVISGGTGGITGAVVQDIAQATKGTFYLLGRTNLLDKDDPELRNYRQGREAFRLGLQQKAVDSREKMTPVQLEQKLSVYERVAAAFDVMEAVQAAGGKAIYLQCDVTDTKSVTRAVETIRKTENKVTVFIHAAGLEKSRKIESKPLQEFQQVIAVKASGFVNFFNAFERASLLPEKVVFFSSVAGRFGNAGQTDYSAANDLLSKISFWLPGQYPGMQAVSIDWGAWAEVGMASRGNTPRLMQLAGIEMLKPEVAAPLVRQELAQGYSGEVVIAGSLGRLETSQNAESVLNIEKADQALRAGSPIHRMFSRLTDFSPNSGIRLEAELDPAELSYLRDHAINGIPVLPGVMGIEGFSVAAKHIASVLATTGAGFEVEGLEDIQFYAPFKFYGNKPRKITWNAVVYRTEAGMTARVNLESELKRRNGTVDRILHFEGLVLLSTHPMPDQVRAKAPVWSKQKFVSAEDIYKLFFHGPSFQVLEAAQLSESTVLGRFNKHIVGVSVEESDALMAPMLIELCFQTAGLWEAGATGILSLPQSLGSLKLYRQSLNGEAIYAQVNPHECDGKLSFDARVIDAKGNVYLELIDYRTSPMPYSAQKELVEPMKVLVAAQPLQNCN